MRELIKSAPKGVENDIPKDSTKIFVKDYLDLRGTILIVPHRTLNGLNINLIEAKIIVDRLSEIIKIHEKDSADFQDSS